MKKYISMTVTLVLVMGIGYVLLQSPNPPDAPPTVGSGPASSTPMSPIPPSANVTIKDGVQYITVNAKGGYSPQSSYAKGGMPTKLIVKTDGTYDCSSSLVIRSV